MVYTQLLRSTDVWRLHCRWWTHGDKRFSLHGSWSSRQLGLQAFIRATSSEPLSEDQHSSDRALAQEALQAILLNQTEDGPVHPCGHWPSQCRHQDHSEAVEPCHVDQARPVNDDVVADFWPPDTN